MKPDHHRPRPSLAAELWTPEACVDEQKPEEEFWGLGREGLSGGVGGGPAPLNHSYISPPTMRYTPVAIWPDLISVEQDFFVTPIHLFLFLHDIADRKSDPPPQKSNLQIGAIHCNSIICPNIFGENPTKMVDFHMTH